MKTLRITSKYGKGKIVLVDEDDFENLYHYKWSLSIPKKYEKEGYVHTFINKKYHSLHRLVLKAPKGVMVDHINGNTLDNRKENLRLCTSSSNQYNTSKKRNNTSGYKGVSFQKDMRRYTAKIGVNNKVIYLGSFKTAEEASEAYLKAFNQFSHTAS